jgi:hypothetical protein
MLLTVIPAITSFQIISLVTCEKEKKTVKVIYIYQRFRKGTLAKTL